MLRWAAATVVLYVLIATSVAESIKTENAEADPAYDRRNAVLCGFFWPVFLFALVLIALSNWLLRQPNDRRA